MPARRDRRTGVQYYVILVLIVGLSVALHSEISLHLVTRSSPFSKNVLAARNSETARQGPAPDDADPLASARALVQHGLFADAERSVRGYLGTHKNSASGHFLLGYILFKEVKPEKSLAEYTEGAKYQIPGASELKVVALDYVLLRDYVDADKWLTRALEQDPNDSDVWYYLGRAKYNENRFAEAVNAFQQCLTLDPKNVKAEDNLGLSYAGLDRNDEAIVAYKNAIAWQSGAPAKNPDPFINIGELLLEQNRPEEAVSYLMQAVAISAEVYRSQGMAELEPRAHEYLGKAYSRINRPQEAKVELEKAVELAPEDARLHYLLGQLYQKMGARDKAKAEFDRFAALSRAHNAAQNNKQTIAPPLK
jgi:Flp pilus assembly protein TadD